MGFKNISEEIKQLKGTIDTNIKHLPTMDKVANLSTKLE